MNPAVLIIGGLDPSGGAGLAADIQTITAHGAHPAPVATAITVQTRERFDYYESLSADLVADQVFAALSDLPVQAVKLGMLGEVKIGLRLAEIFEKHPNLPLVVDPIFKTTSGGLLANQRLLDVYRQTLLPMAKIATPNVSELRALVPSVAVESAAARLLSEGLNYLLVTDGDSPSDSVANELYGPNGFRSKSRWPKLPGEFHGTGCTLASAIAARIAKKEAVPLLVGAAERYTHDSIRRALFSNNGRVGIPRRNYEHYD